MFRQETISQREAVLVVGGPLFGDAVAEFDKRMQVLCAGRFFTVTIDLSQTPTINSAALGKLILFRAKLTEQGKTLQIRGCSPGLLKIFQMIRLDKLIQITD